jgi:YHS domain-containing protein
MLRFILMSLLLTLIVRAIGRLFDNFMQGLRGDPSPATRVPQRGVQMARDPVCGTFVVPDHALSIVDGRQRVYFCSAACRDKYPSTRSGRQTA